MNLSETDSEAIDPSESPSVYFCPTKPIYTWILTETAAFYVSITAKSIASPLTVLLNVLIIVAMKKRRALQKNSSILLTSMAVAELLVGAVSMPLTTALDILLLRKKLSLTICKIAGASSSLQRCYIVLVSFDFHCLGSLRSDKEVEELQNHCHKNPPQNLRSGGVGAYCHNSYSCTHLVGC